MTYSLILKDINFKIESLNDLPRLKQIMEINNISSLTSAEKFGVTYF